MNFITETVDSAYNSATPAVKRIIDNPSNALTIKNLADKYNLNLVQAGKLGDVAMLAMTGLIKEADLPKEIEQMVGVNSTQAGEIASAINREILQKIKNLNSEGGSIATLRQSPTPINDLKTTFPNQYTSLPPEVKQIIDEGDWVKTASNIAERYFLDSEQAIKLKNEVAFVLLEIEDSANLTKNVTDNVGTSTDTAEQIAENIKRQILAPINDAIQKAAANALIPVDPLTEAKNKFARIASKGRFPADMLIKRFETLPANVQALVIGNEIAKTITPISVKYDLHIDQGGVLAEIAILVMLGLVKTTDFIAELERGLGITKIKAGDIAYEIDQKLFKPIREDLKKTAEAKTAEPVAPLISTQSPLPTDSSDIIHPHPAQKPYYGSAPNIVAPTQAKTETSTITDQKLSTVVTAPKQTVEVKRTIDPYREPIN